MPPKGFKKNIKLINQKVGPARRQELLDNIDNQGTFLPRGVSYSDMDETFIRMMNTDVEVVIEGKKVPIIFLTIQRWAEFSKTWQQSDDYKDIKLPFITIVRRPDVQVGTNQAGNWNIPGHRGYTYVKVATFEGNRKGVDVYKIPQPTAVDVTYDVRLFCNRMRDINEVQSIIQQLFQSRQHYIYVNEHPMPVVLENVADESKTDDFEKRKYYVQNFEMKLLGYILDEDEFTVIPTVNRMRVNEALEGDVVSNRRSSTVSYNLEFLAGGIDTYTITAEFDTVFMELESQVNIATIDIYVGGQLTSLPLSLTGGDTVDFVITRTDVALDSSFTLTGIKQ